MTVECATVSELPWIEKRSGCVLTRNARAIKAVDRYGAIRGMVAYDNWTENAVQAHMAVETPIAWRALLRHAFVYPFVDCGRGVILGAILASNEKSQRMARHMGMRETHRVRDGWDVGDDLVLFEMRRDECRWIAAKDKAA